MKKLKASALIYAVFVSVIISLVTIALILYFYLASIQSDNLEFKERLRRNVDSGLTLLLSNQSLVELNESKIIDLFNQGRDSIKLTRKQWGAFEICVSSGRIKKNTLKKIAQVGFGQTEEKAYSLYLADADKPISVCGETKIKGLAYLPKAGVKRAYIEGQNFKGEKLIDGEIRNSAKSLPDFNKKLIDNLLAVFTSKKIGEEDSTITLEGSLMLDTLENDFENKTLVLKNVFPINISKGYYKGNIAIISDCKIVVSQEAQLDNVLLFAPKIIINKNFRGNIQAYASDSLIVEKEVRLFYPSVLGLIQDAKSSNLSVLIIDENDTISGSLFAIKKENDNTKQAGILIAKKTEITGQIYSTGYVDFKGNLTGSLMTNKIILKTSSSVYENHFLNVVIDRVKLPIYFVGINLAEESAHKKVVKWLN